MSVRDELDDSRPTDPSPQELSTVDTSHRSVDQDQSALLCRNILDSAVQSVAKVGTNWLYRSHQLIETLVGNGKRYDVRYIPERSLSIVIHTKRISIEILRGTDSTE